jgi:superfamily II DNA/RNA helicase
MVKGTRPLTIAEFSKMAPKDFCSYFKDTLMFFKNEQTKDYPKRIETTVRIPMTSEYYKEYRKVETKSSHLYKVENPYMFLSGIRQATNALDPCQKCNWTINKILEGQKTIIYSAFLTNGIKKLQTRLDRENVPYAVVSGSIKQADRVQAVHDYNHNKVKVLFITKAGGEGLDLKGTRNVILLEKSWNRPTEEQIIGRAVRYLSHAHLPEKERVVHVYHLVLTKPPVDQREKKSGEPDSGDEILERITNEKEKQNANFLKLMIAASDGTSVCPPPGFELNEIVTTKPGSKKVYRAVIIDKRDKLIRDKLYKSPSIFADSIEDPEKTLAFVSDDKGTEITLSSNRKGIINANVKQLLRAILNRRTKLPKGLWAENNVFKLSIKNETNTKKRSARKHRYVSN